MKKYEIKLWMGYSDFEQAKNHNGVYMTIKLTPNEEVFTEKIDIFNDGVFMIPCYEYEILGTGTCDDWFKSFYLGFDGETIVLHTVKKEDENVLMSFPKEIND